MMIINRLMFSKYIALALAAFMMVACTADNQDLKRYIESVKAKPPKPLEKAPDFTPVPAFTYPVIANRRDPFKKPDTQIDENKYAPDQNRNKQPLELFPLDALKFKGILKQGGTIWGLIAQPDGRIVKVRTGDYLGQNFGKILLINNDSIKLEELVKNQGKWEKKFITLNLDAGSNTQDNANANASNPAQ